MAVPHARPRGSRTPRYAWSWPSPSPVEAVASRQRVELSRGQWQWPASSIGPRAFVRGRDESPRERTDQPGSSLLFRQSWPYERVSVWPFQAWQFLHRRGRATEVPASACPSTRPADDRERQGDREHGIRHPGTKRESAEWRPHTPSIARGISLRFRWLIYDPGHCAPVMTPSCDDQVQRPSPLRRMSRIHHSCFS